MIRHILFLTPNSKSINSRQSACMWKSCMIWCLFFPPRYTPKPKVFQVPKYTKNDQQASTLKLSMQIFVQVRVCSTNISWIYPPPGIPVTTRITYKISLRNPELNPSFASGILGGGRSSIFF